eukprot:1870817-Amphidinium_carterae.5
MLALRHCSVYDAGCQLCRLLHACRHCARSHFLLFSHVAQQRLIWIGIATAAIDWLGSRAGTRQFDYTYEPVVDGARFHAA